MKGVTHTVANIGYDVRQRAAEKAVTIDCDPMVTLGLGAVGVTGTEKTSHHDA